jgi:hypothetical protein
MCHWLYAGVISCEIKQHSGCWVAKEDEELSWVRGYAVSYHVHDLGEILGQKLDPTLEARAELKDSYKVGKVIGILRESMRVLQDCWDEHCKHLRLQQSLRQSIVCLPLLELLNSLYHLLRQEATQSSKRILPITSFDS